MSDDSPRGEYTRLLDARRASVEQMERRHRTMGNCRLLLAIAAAILAFLAFGFTGYFSVVAPDSGSSLSLWLLTSESFKRGTAAARVPSHFTKTAWRD